MHQETLALMSTYGMSYKIALLTLRLKKKLETEEYLVSCRIVGDFRLLKPLVTQTELKLMKEIANENQ